MTIATLRPDGWPQATTVGYANEGLTLYFLCGPDSQKAANLARDDRVSLTIDHDTPQVMEITGLSMAARAQVVVDPAEAGEGLASADAEVSAAGLHTTANADPGGCPHIPRDPDGHLRARLLQGLRTHRSRHLLSAFPTGRNRVMEKMMGATLRLAVLTLCQSAPHRAEETYFPRAPPHRAGSVQAGGRG